MRDRRKFPRFYYECVRAYIPGYAKPFEVGNLSLKGCFIPMENPPRPGTILNLELELPSIGRIPIRAIVMHQGGSGTRGAGLQFLEIEGGFHHVYAKFLKALQLIEEARNIYDELISSEE
ncbi:PilZ domain-containing protein [Thermosulfurimonas dismutans]|uniref:PilZ domain-containing protein n=1 Tax=Thermosulfurimonas dismutans TaxID=999894 RepID=A0A179D802_9BACT|nr:PilZ domain-containing protein [Thermosulfurimonas dismutans]OAQ21718.1 hypothetical protein TDIS_0236 [Thermosulfurimonas dismutans]